MRTVVLCILMIFWLNDSLTQSFTPQFMNYSTNEGLPSSEVHEIFQDKSGYLWFGTDNGLARLDGYSSKIFTIRFKYSNDKDVMIAKIKDSGPGLSTKPQGNIHELPNYKPLGGAITKNKLLLINTNGATKFKMTEIEENIVVGGTLVDLNITVFQDCFL